VGQRVVLFLCSGNTCRSPLAQALARRRWPPHLVVRSAGLGAAPGQPASPGAVEVAAELGADLVEHRSQALTPRLLAEADWVIGMTRAQVATLKARFGPQLRGRVGLLGAPGVDLREVATPPVEEIRDPFGGVVDDYRAIAQQIDRLLAAWEAALTSEDVSDGGTA
jgi:protein-tyrosine-phosphatase